MPIDESSITAKKAKIENASSLLPMQSDTVLCATKPWNYVTFDPLVDQQPEGEDEEEEADLKEGDAANEEFRPALKAP